VERFLIYAQVELLAVSPHDRLTAWQNAPVSSAAELLKIVASQCAYPARRFNDLVLDLEDGRAAISDELFTQLARELVDNAFKFSKAGALVKITARPGPQRYEIQVQDHGRGMQVQEIKAVGALMQFQRKFYEQKGSGLGLIIARRLAEIHGGALTVQSTAGQGTTVNVTLPAADASAEP
jgi:signal transduction histidine kinase